METFRNKWSTLTNLLDVLKIFFRFTYIDSFFVPGNLFLFFNLKSEYLFKSFIFLIFACDFNLSARNLVLYKKSSFYFIRIKVNSIK